MPSSFHDGSHKEHRRHRRSPEIRFFTIAEIADFTGVSVRTVRRWIDDELLPAHRIGRVLRVAESDLQAFLAAHRQ